MPIARREARQAAENLLPYSSVKPHRSCRFSPHQPGPTNAAVDQAGNFLCDGMGATRNETVK
jgi:hypothetical protein